MPIDTACEGSTLMDLEREVLEESEESAREYLRQGWISSAMGELRAARRKAGLTQQVIADRLGTTQSAIARLERDHDCSLSLRRYIDYLIACDVLPLDIETAPLAAVREYALTNPDASRTGSAYISRQQLQDAVRAFQHMFESLRDQPASHYLVQHHVADQAFQPALVVHGAGEVANATGGAAKASQTNYTGAWLGQQSESSNTPGKAWAA